MRNIYRDERGVLIGWLVRLALGFAVVAVVLYDTGSIFVNFFQLDTTANDIAVEVSREVSGPRTLPNQAAVEEHARELAKEAGARLVSVTLEEQALVVTIRRRADTLIVDRISPIRDWALATSDGRSSTQ